MSLNKELGIGRLRRRGFTVIEVLIFAAILLLLLGCIALVVQGAMRYFRTGNAYQEAQNNALVGMRYLTEELSECSNVKRAPVAPFVDADYIIALSPEPLVSGQDWTYGPGGVLQYHQWLCFYRNATTNELRRATLPVKGAPVDSGSAPNPPPVSDFKVPTMKTNKIIARGCTELRVNEEPMAKQISLRLSCSVDTGSVKKTTITSRSVVTLANP